MKVSLDNDQGQRLSILYLTGILAVPGPAAFLACPYLVAATAATLVL
jgi:hypothetical protein